MVHRYAPYNNHRKNFVVESENDITGGLQEPTYVSFHILFDFDLPKIDDNVIRNGYDDINDLMADGLLLDNSHPYSAEVILQNNANHLTYLLEFKSLLSLIQYESPWEFQDVENIKELWKESHNTPDQFDPSRHFGKEITIECLEDRGWKMHMLADLYRNLSYDSRWQMELLNINSRRFSCKIIIHELREFNSISSTVQQSIANNGSPFNSPNYGRYSAFNRTKTYNNNQEPPSLANTVGVGTDNANKRVYTGNPSDISDTRKAVDLESGVMANPFGSASGNTFMNTLASQVANQAASAASRAGQNALTNLGVAAQQRISGAIQNPALKNLSEKAVSLAQNGLSSVLDSQLNPDTAGNIFGQITQGLNSGALQNAFGGQRNGGSVIIEQKDLKDNDVITIKNKNNGKTEINQLIIFELKNCEFIFDDLELAEQLSVKSEKIKESKKFKFKIRVGRVHQTSLYGVYSINVQDVHELGAEGTEIITTSTTEPYPLYTSEKFDILHKRIFPENPQLIQDRSTRAERKNLDSNFLISAAEGLLLDGASSLVNVLVAEPLNGLSDSLLDLDIGITKEQIVIAELDHKLENAELNKTPISNTKDIFKEDANIIDLSNELLHEYSNVKLDHSLSHEYNDVNLDHELTSQLNDVNLDHSLSHEYNDVNLDHELSSQLNDVNLDHELTSQLNDVNLGHELTSQLNGVNLDHELTSQLNDVNLDHELTSQLNDVNLDHELTSQLNDVNLDHELTSQLNDVNLDHELTSQLNDVNLDHELTSQLNDVNLDHELTSQLNDVNLDHELTSQLNDVNLDHELTSQLNDLDLSHSLSHEINTLDLGNVITPPELGNVDLSSELITNNNNSESGDIVSLDNELEISEINTDLSTQGSLDGLLQSELSKVNLEHSLTSEIGKIDLQHNLSITELEGVDLRNTLDSNEKERINLEEVLIMPELNSNLTNTNLEKPRVETINTSNVNLIPEIEKVKLDNSLNSEQIESVKMDNQIESAQSNTDSKIENKNFLFEAENINRPNLDNNIALSEITIPNLDSEITHNTNLDGNLSNSELSVPNANSVNLDMSIENPNIQTISNDNLIDSNIKNSINFDNNLSRESVNTDSLKGNLDVFTNNNRPNLSNETIISKPEKIELQSNLERAQILNIDTQNESNIPSLNRPNLENSLNTANIQTPSVENDILKPEIPKTPYEAKLEMLKNRTELNSRDIEISKSEITSSPSLDNSIEPNFSPKTISKPSQSAIDPNNYRQPYNILEK